MTIAKTLIAQLGGNKFIAMTGAKNFAATGNSMQFRFKGRRANSCQIVLEMNDTYTTRFFNIRGFNVTKTAEVSGLHAEDLARAFTAHTGLAVAL